MLQVNADTIVKGFGLAIDACRRVPSTAVDRGRRADGGLSGRRAARSRDITLPHRRRAHLRPSRAERLGQVDAVQDDHGPARAAGRHGSHLRARRRLGARARPRSPMCRSWRRSTGPSRSPSATSSRWAARPHGFLRIPRAAGPPHRRREPGARRHGRASRAPDRRALGWPDASASSWPGRSRRTAGCILLDEPFTGVDRKTRGLDHAAAEGAAGRRAGCSSSPPMISSSCRLSATTSSC